MSFSVFFKEFLSSKHLLTDFTFKLLFSVQQFMTIKVPLLGKLFSTLRAQKGIGVKLFMDGENIFSEEFLWTERAMKIPLSCLVDCDVAHQFGFCFKALTTEITEVALSVWMLRYYMLGQLQFSFYSFFTVFTFVLEDLLPDKSMQRLLVRDEIVLVSKYLVTDPTLEGRLPLAGV